MLICMIINAMAGRNTVYLEMRKLYVLGLERLLCLFLDSFSNTFLGIYFI